MISKREILDAFTQIAAAKEQVRLMNNHRGVPVSYDATIEEVQGEDVVFRVNKYQIVCLELDRYTYIQNPSLPTVIKGRVARLDVVATLATLTHFEPASDTIGRRMFIRVQPKDPVDVIILYHGEKIRGNLADISSTGVGVFMLSALIRNPGLLRKSEPVQLTIRLPGEKGLPSEVRLEGTIQYVNPDKGSFRLGISTSLEAQSRNIVSQFVNRRQSEILHELKILYDTFYRMKQENKPDPTILP